MKHLAYKTAATATYTPVSAPINKWNVTKKVILNRRLVTSSRCFDGDIQIGYQPNQVTQLENLLSF